MAIEEPAFQVISRDAKIEIRQYTPFIVAQTYVDGDMDDAGNQGFRRIADFIFGNNQTPGSDTSNKIAMTAPVTMEAQQQQWRLHFVMPQGMTLGNLPKPIDSSVQLREMPAQRMASVRFSGLTTAASIQRHTQMLKDWLTQQQLVFEDKPQVARYNDPFTLPWNRRNEILIPVKAAPTP